jgi:DNA phosphorothioation-dependent restriction protein DptH
VAHKLADSVAREILRLHNDRTDIPEIAQRLDLKKVQVSSIIAHHQISTGLRSLGTSDNAGVDSEQDTDAEDGGLPGEDNLKRSELIAQYTASPELSQKADEIASAEEELTPGGIFIGQDKEFNDPLYWNPQLAAAVQNPHMMIVGESGSGKTYAAQCLIAELAQREIPSVIFDYGQGFELDTLDPILRKYVGIHEYRLGEDGIALNPLQIFPKDIKGPASVATRLSDVFDAVYHLGHIQRKVLIEAILSAFEKRGITTEKASSWASEAPTFAQLQQTLDEWATDKQYANAKNVLGLAARLTTFFMLSSFGAAAKPWSWEAIVADTKHRVHILQFRGLEGKTQKVTVEVLLWHLFFYLKSHGQGQLRLYCVLDEAHHLSFREGGPVDLLLREARKFGLGIIFASQQPEDFTEVAFSNTASKLIFQTADPSSKVSRYLAVKTTNYDSPDEIHNIIAVQSRGDAFFITQNRGHKVHVADLGLRATQWKVV